MKRVISFIFFFIINSSVYCQITESNKFDIDKFNELVKESGNEIHNQFKKNDSIVYMTYDRNGISSANVVKGNYSVLYFFYPNLNLKSRREGIYGKMHVSEYFVRTEKEYSENGELIREFNWDKAPLDTDILGPKYTVWEIKKKC